MRDEVAVLYSEEEIARRVAELGAEIGRAFAGRELCVLGLMKGSLVFMADLDPAHPARPDRAPRARQLAARAGGQPRC